MTNRNKNSTTSESTSSSDEWLQITIGNFGKWQCWISFLLSLFKFPIAWVQMSIIFLAPPTSFWCSPPMEYRNISTSQWLDISRPENKSEHPDKLNNGFCKMKNLNGSDELMACNDGYDYNRTIFQSSIITEWNLICGRENLVDISQIILMTGILVGNMVFGLYADRYGRKPILIICIILQTIFGFVASWSPWYWGFVAARFLVAVANGGTLVVSFVMCIEIVGGKWRAIIPILSQAPISLGYSFMGILAYYVRDWRDFQYILSSISILFIWYIWLIPESPRWLFVKGRPKEARLVLEEAAKFNGIKAEVFEKNFSKLTHFPTNFKKPHFKDLFSTPVLAMRTVWLCIIWLFSGMSFFTITQYVGHVGQNIFLSTIAGGLVGIPGQFLCLYMVSKFGRRNTIAFWTLITAVAFFSIINFPKGMYPHDWQRMALAGVGIIGISVSLCGIYLFTGELFPTVVRNTGMGLCSVCARIGSMLAPLVISLHDTAPFLPLLFLGIINIIDMFLVLMLPETKGKVLPELISDLNVVDRDESKKSSSNNNDYVQVPSQENTMA